MGPVEEVAAQLRRAVIGLAVGFLHGRAGNRPWGFVEPPEAAWELRGEAIRKR